MSTDGPHYEPGGYDDPVIAFHDPNQTEIDFDPKTLSKRINEILERAIDPKATTTYHGETMAIEDIPSPLVRIMMGMGHHPFDADGKTTLRRPDGEPWPYSSLGVCLVAAEIKGVWVDETHLACAGCGLDYT